MNEVIHFHSSVEDISALIVALGGKVVDLSGQTSTFTTNEVMEMGQ